MGGSLFTRLFAFNENTLVGVLRSLAIGKSNKSVSLVVGRRFQIVKGAEQIVPFPRGRGDMSGGKTLFTIKSRIEFMSQAFSKVVSLPSVAWTTLA